MLNSRALLALWIRAGIVTTFVDFLFATTLSVVFYKGTFARLWQGVASVPFGPGAVGGGATWTVIGILVHICVAFGWSLVFMFLVSRWTWLRRLLLSTLGVLKAAVLYGPFIWVMMSLVFIPLARGAPPAPIGFRWVIQVFGHIGFVGIPMLWTVARGLRRLQLDP